MADREDRSAIPSAPSRLRASPERKRILAIDDDPDSLRIILFALRSDRYKVSFACNGTQGIERARAEIPDLVLTDLSMPMGSGVEVIDILRRDPRTRHIPVVAVTAYFVDQIAQAAMDVGCAGRLGKPFTAKQLVEKVEQYLQPEKAAGTGAPNRVGTAVPPSGNGRLRLR